MHDGKPNRWTKHLGAGMWVTALGLLAPLTGNARAPEAAPVLLTCTGSERATFTPGLKLYPQTVSTRIEQQLAPCVGDERITSGTAVLAFTAEQACLSTDLPGTVPGAQTLTWNTGETSRFVYTKTYVQNAGLVVAIKTGTITEGLFAGATAVMSIPATSNVLACLSAEGNTVNTALIEFVLTAP
ncbi:MAG: hypothetical protein ABW123_28290 [Cystobacter sp.]